MLAGKTVVMVGPNEGTAWNVGGVLQCKLSAEKTEGAYTVLELALAPQGGAPLHVHHREDEIFYILEGECTIGFEDQVIKALSGSTIMLPKGTAHFFRNDTANACRILITAVPGGLDRYFEEVSAALESGREEAIPAINKKYEIDFFQ